MQFDKDLFISISIIVIGVQLTMWWNLEKFFEKTSEISPISWNNIHGYHAMIMEWFWVWLTMEKSWVNIMIGDKSRRFRFKYHAPFCGRDRDCCFFVVIREAKCVINGSLNLNERSGSALTFWITFGKSSFWKKPFRIRSFCSRKTKHRIYIK